MIERDQARRVGQHLFMIDGPVSIKLIRRPVSGRTRKSIRGRRRRKGPRPLQRHRQSDDLVP